MTKEKAQLPLDTARKYIIIGDFSRRHYFGSFGEIDFNTLNEKHCAALMHGGFPYLMEKAASCEPQAANEKVVQSELETYALELDAKNPFANIEAQVKKKYAKPVVV